MYTANHNWTESLMQFTMSRTSAAEFIALRESEMEGWG